MGIKSFISLLFFLSIAPSDRPSKTHPVTIPTQVVENMFYAHAVTNDGVELNFYTDSGGMALIWRRTVDQLHLTTIKVHAGDEDFEQVKLPAFLPGKGIPLPLGSDGKFVVNSDEKSLAILGDDVSGMLGQNWFADRVWTWDYPGRKLLWRAEGDLPDVSTEHRIQLGFPAYQGKRGTNFPRIQATIDGEVIDFLFDTGATTVLTDSAMKIIHDGHAAHRAASFINQSILDRWHTKHPDWKMVENADGVSGSTMIEVPIVTVAGYQVGPVWFTARPDKQFDEWMSQWMDKKIHGALGGSIFQYFQITVDYPNAMAYFEKDQRK
jgi:hypothetical protein